MTLASFQKLGSIGWAALAGIIALLGNIDLGAEGGLTAISAAVRRHPASGQIMVVEVDAASLARLHSWPWPRSFYADAIDRLTHAGARSIGFDIDFSATSDAKSDSALAAALRRAGGSVYLPTFRQRGAFGGDGWIDSLPIAPLREASFLAAVNVFPMPTAL
jgi:CHASE2 domain-containing sensor protein